MGTQALGREQELMVEATVRYGYMMHIDTFPSQVPLRRGDKVILQTDRGIELGEVVTVSQPAAPAEHTPAQEQKPEPPAPAEKRVIRKVNRDDLARAKEISENTETAQFKFCQQKIRELALPMKLAVVEHLFGGEKVIFYFLAESRVDFRALVRELAREYRTRIEMKQIGARDEAKLLSDYEHCGREVCCRKFIRSLEPVTIKMAKSQKATLDPSKISGACGRLMCCLRFENATYQEMKAKLPRKGKKVTTPKGEGEVINYDIIAQLVLVEESKGEKVLYGVEDLSWDRQKDSKAKEPPERSSEGKSLQESGQDNGA